MSAFAVELLWPFAATPPSAVDTQTKQKPLQLRTPHQGRLRTCACAATRAGVALLCPSPPPPAPLGSSAKTLLLLQTPGDSAVPRLHLAGTFHANSRQVVTLDHAAVLLLLFRTARRFPPTAGTWRRTALPLPPTLSTAASCGSDFRVRCRSVSRRSTQSRRAASGTSGQDGGRLQ